MLDYNNYMAQLRYADEKAHTKNRMEFIQITKKIVNVRRERTRKQFTILLSFKYAMMKHKTLHNRVASNFFFLENYTLSLACTLITATQCWTVNRLVLLASNYSSKSLPKQ